MARPVSGSVQRLLLWFGPALGRARDWAIGTMATDAAADAAAGATGTAGTRADMGHPRSSKRRRWPDGNHRACKAEHRNAEAPLPAEYGEGRGGELGRTRRVVRESRAHRKEGCTLNGNGTAASPAFPFASTAVKYGRTKSESQGEEKWRR